MSSGIRSRNVTAQGPCSKGMRTSRPCQSNLHSPLSRGVGPRTIWQAHLDFDAGGKRDPLRIPSRSQRWTPRPGGIASSTPDTVPDALPTAHEAIEVVMCCVVGSLALIAGKSSSCERSGRLRSPSVCSLDAHVPLVVTNSDRTCAVKVDDSDSSVAVAGLETFLACR